MMSCIRPSLRVFVNRQREREKQPRNTKRRGEQRRSDRRGRTLRGARGGGREGKRERILCQAPCRSNCAASRPVLVRIRRDYAASIISFSRTRRDVMLQVADRARSTRSEGRELRAG